MMLFTYKPEWNQAFTGATHLLHIPLTDRYVFAYSYKDDFYSSTMMVATFNNFKVLEERPVESDDNSDVKPKYGITGELWEWKSQGYKGYIVGLDVDDGCHAYMNLLDDEGDDVGDIIVGVDLSCLNVVEERPAESDGDFTPEQMAEGERIFNKAAFGKVMDSRKSYKQIEAQGIRKAVAHLKANHGGDRYSSSVYLNYADEIEGITNAIS